MDPPSPRFTSHASEFGARNFDSIFDLLPEDDPSNFLPPPSTDPTGQGSASASISISTRSRKKSDVWEYMEIKEINGVNRACCLICGEANFSCSTSGGTGHIKRHIVKCKNKHGIIAENQPQLHGDPSTGNISTFRYSDEEHRKGIAEWVIQSEHPFNEVEDPNFQRYVRTYLQPAAKFTSRNTLRKDALAQFKEAKLELINILNDLNVVSLTCDSWETAYATHYICVTCHYIDNDWKLQKRIIGFLPFDFPHNAHAIADTISYVAREYSISTKIFTISFDNATNNTAAINLLKVRFHPILQGKLFHVRCVCHIINLIVQDGLTLIDPILRKIKDCVHMLKQNAIRRQEFKALCVNYGLKYKSLFLDVKTRWNSTYQMCMRAYEFKDPLNEYFITKLPEWNLENEDWDKLLLVIKFLEKFNEVTNTFSGIFYPTSHLVLSNLGEICELFAKYKLRYEFIDIVQKMEEKFIKYWGTIPPLFCLATIMDPRFQLEGTLYIIDDCKSNLSVDPIGHEQRDLQNLLLEMFEIYNSRFGNQPETPIEEVSVGKLSYALKFKKSRRSAASSSQNNELQDYLSTDFNKILSTNEMINLDILSWWRSQSKRYPVLSIMARDLLTAPVSTVASESAFSAGNRVLDEKRSRLNAESLEMCVCYKDWLDAKYNTRQHRQDQDPNSDVE